MYFHKLNFYLNQTTTNQAFIIHLIHHTLVTQLIHMIWSNRFFFTPQHSYVNLSTHMIWSGRFFFIPQCSNLNSIHMIRFDQFFFTPQCSHMNLLIHMIWSNRFFFRLWRNHMNLLRLSPPSHLHLFLMTSRVRIRSQQYVLITHYIIHKH